jgi:hypothetical protein
MKTKSLLSIPLAILLVCSSHFCFSQKDDTFFASNTSFSLEVLGAGFISAEEGNRFSSGVGMNFFIDLFNQSEDVVLWGLDIPLRFYFTPESGDDPSFESVSSGFILRAHFPIDKSREKWYFFFGLGPEFYSVNERDEKLSYLGQFQIGMLHNKKFAFFRNLQAGMSFSRNFSSGPDHLDYLSTVFLRFRIF